MAKYKPCDHSQSLLIPVSLQDQLMPGVLFRHFVFIYIDFPFLNLIPVQNCPAEKHGLSLACVSFLPVTTPWLQFKIDESSYEI